MKIKKEETLICLLSFCCPFLSLYFLERPIAKIFLENEFDTVLNSDELFASVLKSLPIDDHLYKTIKLSKELYNDKTYTFFLNSIDKDVLNEINIEDFSINPYLNSFLLEPIDEWYRKILNLPFPSSYLILKICYKNKLKGEELSNKMLEDVKNVEKMQYIWEQVQLLVTKNSTSE